MKSWIITVDVTKVFQSTHPHSKTYASLDSAVAKTTKKIVYNIEIPTRFIISGEIRQPNQQALMMAVMLKRLFETLSEV